MNTTLRRYLGIGNSTGLGMAPFLINHPQLIQQWILSRECARQGAGSGAYGSRPLAPD